ncbi:hypothetical protein IE53DRAFT_405620 [Violaceomyces palustris]|uniref:Uncharacterized protein n=1 Tax=Violaceomyces palustris TaxID=1673888 RepID=A0ACD0P0I0_9BASI|nr:hypothetical protein IE53DRAFT_405620 [Violaceomyces palustris]
MAEISVERPHQPNLKDGTNNGGSINPGSLHNNTGSPTPSSSQHPSSGDRRPNGGVPSLHASDRAQPSAKGRGRTGGMARSRNPSPRPDLVNAESSSSPSLPASQRNETNPQPDPDSNRARARPRRGRGGAGSNKGALAENRGQERGSEVESSKPAASSSNRRNRFGGKLTSAPDTSRPPSDAETSNPATTSSGTKNNGEAGRRQAKPTRRKKATAIPTPTALLGELASGQYDCVVCYNTCHTVLHLGCVKKWAESSVKKVEEQNAMQEDPEIRNRKGTWRCPGCQYAREDIPRSYWCWCGRTMDPQGGRGANPHGCGRKCSKGKCSHGCSDQCHPGPCPPCSVTISQKCFCGSETIPMRCSQSSAKAAIASAKGTSCGSTCSKLLNCGIHRCQDTCHAGPCQPCQVRIQAKCYCGRHAKDMGCGEGERKTSFSIAGQEWEGFWTCKDPCERPFNCGIHLCKRSCHPLDAQDAQCPSLPELIKTCPCGARAITAEERTSCEDPIPTCSSVCSKPFACGHSCPQRCHLGPCPPCFVPVSTPCRCGESKETRPCHERQREESEGKQEVLCNTTCKALRHCGKHQCGRQCCPLYFQAKSKAKKRPTQAELQTMDPGGFHECSVPCSKPLACGRHQCPLTCHRGACPPCLQASFEELECNCGRTIMEPPVPCGATVVCNFPCIRPPPPCGHPKVPHNCHESEDCPPCVFLTDRLCTCQRNVVKNVPCSRSNVSCGQQCGALLNCGFHRCAGTCHRSPAECSACTQMCGKPRKLCLHPCQEKCHAPASCPETEPCQAVITLQCSCGNLQSRAKCGVSIHNPTKEKSLKCNDSCLIAQRNAKLAEALGLNPTEKAAPTAYEADTLLFYSNPANRKFCDELETTLNEFIRSPRAGMILPPGNRNQRKFTHELAAAYRLMTESVDLEPRRSVSVRRKQDSRIPSPLISEAFAAAKASLSANAKPAGLAQLKRPGSEPPRPFNALFLPGVFGHDADSLKALIQPVLKGITFNVLWKGDEDVLVTSETPTRLIMNKNDLKALNRRERLAKDVLLCTADPLGNIVRKEDEPTAAVVASSVPLSRVGSAPGKNSSSTTNANRGWAAIATSQPPQNKGSTATKASSLSSSTATTTSSFSPSMFGWSGQGSSGSRSAGSTTPRSGFNPLAPTFLAAPPHGASGGKASRGGSTRSEQEYSMTAAGVVQQDDEPVPEDWDESMD